LKSHTFIYILSDALNLFQGNSIRGILGIDHNC